MLRPGVPAAVNVVTCDNECSERLIAKGKVLVENEIAERVAVAKHVPFCTTEHIPHRRSWALHIANGRYEHDSKSFKMCVGGRSVRLHTHLVYTSYTSSISVLEV